MTTLPRTTVCALVSQSSHLPLPYRGPEHEPFLWQARVDHRRDTPHAGDRRADHATSAWHQGATKHPQSRAALLIHGFPGTPQELRPLARFLHEQKWTTQGLLLPGFGPQLTRIDQTTWHDWLGAVTDAIDRLYQDAGAVALVGNSMGASLAMVAAVQRPVQSLVLVSPFWRVRQRWVDWLFPVVRGAFPGATQVFQAIVSFLSAPHTHMNQLTSEHPNKYTVAQTKNLARVGLVSATLDSRLHAASTYAPATPISTTNR